MRNLVACAVGAALLLAAPTAEAKDTSGRFALGGGFSVAGLGQAHMTYALQDIELNFGLDLDIGKADAADSSDLFLGLDLGIFWKAAQTTYCNAGLHAGFVGGLRAGPGMDPIFHPFIYTGFRVDWFPDGNDNFAFWVALDLLIDIVPEDGRTLSSGANTVVPAADGFGLALAPNLAGGFRWYFGGSDSQVGPPPSNAPPSSPPPAQQQQQAPPPMLPPM